ncbi:FtsW/RodA/SpoVE family cell cycle protein [Anaerorhabdus furcosa]|uniref:FtsW/RodA/SpoVE family cell cycle protein n=1 Tax=Anaerorhabdus furcosa TaxID=118967 RepID=UPI00099A97D5|nr:FtsW/RodA/SpoVE family cell cycle protein [Anaerorhabdus furcosa]
MNYLEKKRKSGALRMPYLYDRYIHFATIVLVFFGLVMITSASMGLAAGNTISLVNVVAKQIIFSIVGYIAMLMVAKVFTFQRLRDNISLIVIATFVFLLLALAFPSVGGAKAWIRIPMPGGEVTIQPSEFAKISIMLVMAAYLCDLKMKKPTNWELIKTPAILIGSFVLIVAILQSDFGSAVVMLAIAIIIFLIPQHPQLTKYQKIVFLLIVAGIVGVVFLISPIGINFVEHLPLAEYQKSRILSAVNPFVDKYGAGYQLVNGLVSFASGGFFGVGFGNSVRKYTNFPAANTDFILAIVVEELGFLGFMVIFVCYGLIIMRLFKYAFKMKSEKGRVILIGTAMYILIHFIFNVGGVTGLIPLTGVPLLMISYGGSSTMAAMVAIGVSQAVISRYRQGDFE